PVEQWQAIEKLVSAKWTEEAISAALALPVHTIRKLRLLAKLHPPMLDRMAQGDMPGERELRIIAAATLEEQAQVWKKHRPKKGEGAGWWDIARALNKPRMEAKHARFDDEFAKSYGITWEEDLFAPAGEDTRSTTQVDAFLAAQHAWLEAKLPKNGVILEPGQHGEAKLPPKAQRHYGKPTKDTVIGHHINEHTGAIETIAFTMPKPEAKPDKKARTATRGDEEAPAPTAKSRPDITQKGIALIGDMRTDALHQALREAPIDDYKLIGLLILALGGKNVSIHSGNHEGSFSDTRDAIASSLTEGGVLTGDPEKLRASARAMLTGVLSCRENMSNSGMAARFAGDAIGADAWLPNMATEEFLSCLSKPALERAAGAENVPPRQTAKTTRAAMIEQLGIRTYIHPAARFAPNENELAEIRARNARQQRYSDPGVEHETTDSGQPESGCNEAGDDGEFPEAA
ncbi:MAG: plasmid partitioning protein, partial [Acetobacteraceae bacterium]|nr:plasmid partitioning protein [Acetobacteraceae bacterium]